MKKVACKRVQRIMAKLSKYLAYPQLFFKIYHWGNKQNAKFFNQKWKRFIWLVFPIWKFWISHESFRSQGRRFIVGFRHGVRRRAWSGSFFSVKLNWRKGPFVFWELDTFEGAVLRGARPLLREQSLFRANEQVFHLPERTRKRNKFMPNSLRPFSGL